MCERGGLIIRKITLDGPAVNLGGTGPPLPLCGPWSAVRYTYIYIHLIEQVSCTGNMLTINDAAVH